MPGAVGRAARFTGLLRRVIPPASNTPRGSSCTGLGGSKSWCALSLLCAACLHAAAALGGDLGYGAGTYLSYESNINRVETNPSPDLIEAVFGGLSYREDTGDAVARLYSYVERRHYARHTNPDDTRGYLQGTGSWTIMPKRLVWIVDDTFQELQLNVTVPNSPSNLTKSNSLNTGPELIFPLGPVNSLITGARYGRFDIENSNADQQRYLGYVRAVHTTPSRSKLSLNYEATRIFFKPGNSYSVALRQDWFAHFETGESAYAGDGAKIDIGKSRVVQYIDESSTATSGGTLDGHIARVMLSKALSREFTIRASYSDQISDTYSDLIAGIAGSSGTLAPTESPVFLIQGTGTATSDFYHSKRGDLSFSSRGGDIEYTLTPYKRLVDFQTLDQDYNEVGGTFFLRWTLSGATRFDVYGNYSSRNYDTLDRKDTDRNYGASMEFRVNRNLTLSMVAGQTQRQSTAPGNSYVDQRITLFVGYGANYELRFKQ
jgi:hypothetical protein